MDIVNDENVSTKEYFETLLVKHFGEKSEVETANGNLLYKHKERILESIEGFNKRLENFQKCQSEIRKFESYKSKLQKAYNRFNDLTESIEKESSSNSINVNDLDYFNSITVHELEMLHDLKIKLMCSFINANK